MVWARFRCFRLLRYGRIASVWKALCRESVPPFKVSIWERDGCLYDSVLVLSSVEEAEPVVKMVRHCAPHRHAPCRIAT
jgi:hypothetical protein